MNSEICTSRVFMEIVKVRYIVPVYIMLQCAIIDRGAIHYNKLV